MPKFFVKNNQIEKDLIKIEGQDVKHIKNVLRQKVGEEIIICNSSEQKNYLCEIEEINKEYIKCKIKKELEEFKSNVKVTIMQGLPKADKMELKKQKSVELRSI